MAENRVSDFASLINQQINSSEELEASLSKLQALIVVALEISFVEMEKITISEYLWAVNDFINQAIKINREGLNKLLIFSKMDMRR